ncbi:MAG: hypothetical protein ACYC5Y_05275 [Symbiobacteriia bacterium]
MAQLVLPYPDFQPNTKIVSAQVDANNAAILNLLNGNLGPDNVLFPFLATGTLGTDKSGTATAVTQGYNSRDVVLRGSGWDGAAAQDRDMILRQVMTSATAYKLGLYKKEGAVETLLASIDQAGSQVVAGNLTVNGTTDSTFAGRINTTGRNVFNGYGDSIQVILNRVSTSIGQMGIGADVNGFGVWDVAAGTRKFLVTPTGAVSTAGNLTIAQSTSPIDLSISRSAVSGVQIQVGTGIYSTLGSRFSGADLVLTQNAYQDQYNADHWAQANAAYLSQQLMLDLTDGLVYRKAIVGQAAGIESAFWGAYLFRVDQSGNLTVGGKLLHTGLGARVASDVAQSIANNAWTELTFNLESWDTDAIHDTVANNTRLTCQTAGKYLITGNVEFAANAAGDRRLAIRLGGALGSYIAEQSANAVGTAGVPSVLSISTIYDLAAGAYVELMAYQGSGGALNTNPDGEFSPVFSMIKVG